jgi:hypothetical protein
LRVAPHWAIALGILLIGTVAYSTLATPERGLQDRILGTYLVPR